MSGPSPPLEVSESQKKHGMLFLSHLSKVWRHRVFTESLKSQAPSHSASPTGESLSLVIQGDSICSRQRDGDRHQ